MQQDFNQKADEQPAGAGAAAAPENVIVGETVDDSVKGQEQQDALRVAQQEQAEEEEARLRDRFRNSVAPEEESWLKKNSHDLLMRDAGSGVKHNDQEIDLHYKANAGPSQKQLDRAIDLAVKKGWDHLYIYDKGGKPDIRMAAAVNQRIVDRGLQGRICCCTNPREMCASLAEMRAMMAEKASARMALVGDQKGAPQQAAAAHDHAQAAVQEKAATAPAGM